MIFKAFIFFLVSFSAHSQFLDGVRQDDFEANMKEKKHIENMQIEFNKVELERKIQLQEIKSEKDKNIKFGDIVSEMK